MNFTAGAEERCRVDIYLIFAFLHYRFILFIRIIGNLQVKNNISASPGPEPAIYWFYEEPDWLKFKRKKRKSES